jgi:hypothetical protein
MKLFLPVCLAVLLLPSSAAACLCDTLATVERAFIESSAVFTGRYIGAEYRKGIKDELVEIAIANDPKKSEYEVLVYKFEVREWWKGGSKSEAFLVTNHARFADGTEMISDCDVGFEKGKNYLIYAYGDEKEYGTGACTRTRRMKRAKADIAALKRLTGRKS